MGVQIQNILSKTVKNSEDLFMILLN